MRSADEDRGRRGQGTARLWAAIEGIAERIGQSLDRRMVIRGALLAIGVLLAVHLLATIGLDDPQRPDALRRWFLLDHERNVPTLYACLQLGAASTSAAAIAVLRRRRPGSPLPWLGLSVVLAAMTLDEGLILHERLIGRAGDIVSLPDWLVFDWVVLVLPVVIVVGALYLPWVLRLPPPVRNGFVVGGVVFLAGSVGFETLSGVIAHEITATSTAYVLASTAEEILELLGVAIVLDTMIRVWSDTASHLVDTPSTSRP